MLSFIKNLFTKNRTDVYCHEVKFTDISSVGKEFDIGTVMYELYRINGRRKLKIHLPEYVPMSKAKSSKFYITVASPWLHGNKKILINFCAKAGIEITESIFQDSVI